MSRNQLIRFLPILQGIVDGKIAQCFDGVSWADIDPENFTLMGDPGWWRLKPLDSQYCAFCGSQKPTTIAQTLFVNLCLN